ncbi:MAG TPA: type II toxin-antitoxin system PemK/MazF family toxin [Actinoplanes sp.]|nr:type II toxin-antitoxin system PemK/MazF family toxin [Actinoplanes sp.]
MNRGDVVLLNLDPALGSEANKTRPAVVVSNDHANHTATALGRGTITVVPLTSNLSRIYPFQVPIEDPQGAGLSVASKAQAEQVRSVDVQRVVRVLGTLEPRTMQNVDAALRLHLGL